MLPISLRIVAELPIEPHDEIELLFALHHLRRDIAADRGFDQAVDVGYIQPVAGDLGAIDLDGEARLPQFVHQRHIADAAHMLQHFLDRLAFQLQRLQVARRTP